MLDSPWTIDKNGYLRARRQRCETLSLPKSKDLNYKAWYTIRHIITQNVDSISSNTSQLGYVRDLTNTSSWNKRIPNAVVYM